MRPGPILLRLSAVALAASLVLAACQRRDAAPPPEPGPPAAQPPPAPMAPAALDRAKLLQAFDLAASAHAAGRTEAGEDVAGRRFIVRQAFGCAGPADAASPGLARWTWGRDRKSIEIALNPADWTKDPIFSGAGSPWEAIEGFWISRPWMREAGCPAAAVSPDTRVETDDQPPPSAPAQAAASFTAEPQVAGLAAVFAHEGSRVGRRDGKPFAFSLRADDATPLEAPRGGYRLVLEGRMIAFPGGGAIHCRTASPDARPVCIAAAEVDRVAFEDADGKLLREWRPG